MTAIRNDVKEFTTIPWEQFKDYEFNALKPFDDRDVQKMKNAIVNRGFKFPFYVWAGHRYVIDGAGRRKALLELQSEGHTICDLPVVMVDAPTLEAAKEMVLMASSHHGRVTQSSFDEFASDLSLEALMDMIEIPDISFSSDEVKIEKLEPQGDPDEAPESREADQPFTKTGDVYDIGGHRLICGDTLIQDTWDKVLNGAVADMCFTAPPQEDMDNEEYYEFMCEFTTSGMLYANLVILDVPHPGDNLWAYLEWLHFYRHNIVDMAIWDKGAGVPSARAHNTLSPRFDSLVFIQQADATSRAIPGANFKGNIQNVYQGDPPRGKGEEKKAFPLHLPEWVMNSFLSGKTIIDPFGGTGTTMVAAQKLGKQCFMIERNPHLCDVIVARMKQVYPTIKVIHNNQMAV